VQAIAALDGWDRVSMRREQMNGHEVGLIPQEVAAGQNEKSLLITASPVIATGPSGGPCQ
jgi:hypothetical protein